MNAGTRSMLPVLSCFLLSGASGLVYEIVWTRMLALVFGGTTLAISTILTAFLGGLALGAWLGGRLADRLSRPLRVYGLIELAVGLYALATPWVFASAAFAQLWRGLADPATAGLLASFLARFAMAALVILPPTVLMGATLPLLVAAVARHDGDVSRRAAWLYSLNTVGAVTGAFLAGFVLMPAAGVGGAVLVAAIGNFAAGVVCLLLSRSREPGTAAPRADATAQAPAGRAPGERRLLVAYGVSGFAALLLEVGWSRALSLVMGSSTQAFATMLGVFLAGLAMGAAAASALLPRVRHPWRALALVQLGVAISTFLGLSWLGELPRTFVDLHSLAGGSWTRFQILKVGAAAAIMLVPTMLLGAMFPLAARVTVAGGHAAAATGRLYSANTLGAILGSFLGGFTLLPLFGLEPLLRLSTLIAAALAAVLLAASPRAARPLRGRPLEVALGVAAAATLLAAIVTAPRLDPVLMSAGVSFYIRDLDPGDRQRLDEQLRPAGVEIVFHRDGRTSTVTVEESATGNWRRLRTSGKVEGQVPIATDRPAVGLDLSTQTLLGALPVLLHPDTPARALVIGHGTGMSAGAALCASDVESLTIVEIEPFVFTADRWFRPANHEPLEDPRCKAVADDGRNYLLTTHEQFDVIVSQPAEPWISGSAALFTREHWDLAASRLAPGGMFCQWIPCYGLPPAENAILLRTFLSCFPHVRAFHPHRAGEVILIGSASPWRIDLDTMRARMQAPALANALCGIGVTRPEELVALCCAGSTGLRLVAGEGRLNTDDSALVELTGPRAMFELRGDPTLLNFAALMARPVDLDLEIATDEDTGAGPLLELAWSCLESVNPARQRDPLWQVWNLQRAWNARLLAAAASRRETTIATEATRQRTEEMLRVLGHDELVGEVAIPAIAPQNLPEPSSVLDHLAILQSASNLPLAQLVELCARAEARFPLDSRILAAIGAAALERGSTVPAIAALERAVALAPGDLASRIDLARARLMAGEPAAARDALAPILALRPGSSQLQYWLGRIALALDDIASARAALEIAPRLGPVPLDAHAHLGMACEQLGDSRAALAASESFVRGASGTALAAEVAARIEALRRSMAPR